MLTNPERDDLLRKYIGAEKLKLYASYPTNRVNIFKRMMEFMISLNALTLYIKRDCKIDDRDSDSIYQLIIIYYYDEYNKHIEAPYQVLAIYNFILKNKTWMTAKSVEFNMGMDSVRWVFKNHAEWMYLRVY